MQDPNAFQRTDSMIGKLLVASSTVQDPVLSRAVCLVVHQDTENVFAVLLNRPMTPPPGLAELLGAAESPTKLSGDAMHRFAGNPGIGPTETSEFVAEHAAAEASISLGTIHFGGPLSGPVVAVHSSSEHAESEAGKGVYVAAQRKMLETLMKQKPGSFRLIVGHLGWSVEQLRSETESGFWHTIDATGDDVFTGDQDLWPSVIRRATTATVAHWLGIKDASFAAEVN